MKAFLKNSTFGVQLVLVLFAVVVGLALTSVVMVAFPQQIPLWLQTIQTFLFLFPPVIVYVLCPGAAGFEYTDEKRCALVGVLFRCPIYLLSMVCSVEEAFSSDVSAL